MINEGVYYFWLSRSYPWGDIGRSITQWVYIGLNATYCEGNRKAFPACISQVERQPWGYVCKSRTIANNVNEDQLINDQLDLIKKDIIDQSQLHELAGHLRPLEERGYWSEELEKLLENYIEIEEIVYQEGLKRKCEWLIQFIKKRNINFDKEKIRFQVESYARGNQRVKVTFSANSVHDPLIDWISRHVSIKPKGGGKKGYRIQPADIVLYYPVYKELITNIEGITDELGLQKRIEKRWGKL